MKVIYDPVTDTLDFLFREEPVVESDEIREWIILDYVKDGKLVSIEMPDASKHVGEPETMIYQSKLMKS